MEENIVNSAEQAPGESAPAAFDTSALNSLEGDNFRNIIPESVRGKPYLKDVNNFGDFVKKFDNAQGMIGKPVIPSAEATPEEWDGFYNKLGRPTEPKGYDFGTVEGVPEEYVKNVQEVGVLKDIMHKAGLSPRQAKAFSDGFLKSIYKAETEQKTAGDEKFNKFMDTTFGQNKAAILENGKKFLATTLPDSVKPFLNDLDDKGLAVVIATADAIVKKHVNEDGFLGKGAPASGKGGDTEASITAEMRTILADPAYGDPFKDRTKHAALNEQMESCRTRLKNLKFKTS